MKKPYEKSSQSAAAVLDERAESSALFDVRKIRAQFPILQTKVHGKPLIYFDNAATTQKPQIVIDALLHYYQFENANIHRGVHTLSQEATSAYEHARRKIARFINAAEDRQIIFTRGTTEGINLVASSYGRKFLRSGDEIILSAMEHHSNIVPWQILAEEIGAKIRVIPMNDRGELLMDEFDRLLNDRTKIVSMVHLSNSLGTVNPVREIIAKAHQRGAVVVVDGAQWVAHAPTDVRELDADFYAFSGHKLYGPTGIGVLYGNAKLLEAMPPYQGGGDMISSVTFEKTTYNVLPHKFEAGTPHIAGGIGLGAAIDFVSSVGLEKIARHEQELLAQATALLKEIPRVRIVGTARDKGSVISFVVENPSLSSLDVGAGLDADGIAVRTGHHCCQPVMDRLMISATARASFAMYNTKQEIEALAASLRRIVDKARIPVMPQPPEKIVYPSASASSPTVVADQLAGDFEMLSEPSARAEYLDELGGSLPNLFDILKQVTTRVPGCMSEVYLVARPSPQQPGALEFVADANSSIVRGLIAVLERLFSGQPAAKVLAFDIDRFFERIGLDKFLTAKRRIGLEGMVRRIRSEAASISAK
jgi:cysteine desulfurase / selenocysteine lyase